MKLQQKTVDRLQSRYGKWALVTGASSGIGREIAVALGEAGFNLVICARREAILKELSSQLFEKHQVEVIPYAGDLSKEATVRSLLEETAHLNIGIAILNAGFGSSGKVLEYDLDNELNMVDLNCRTVLHMATHYAQAMKAQNQKGAIVLVSSILGFHGAPFAANYAATKAYVQSLGEGIARELKPEGIDVLTAAPGPVETGFASRADMKMGQTQTAEKIALSIINAIGRKSTTIPGFLSKFLAYNLMLVPRWAKVRIMEKVMGGFTKHQESNQ